MEPRPFIRETEELIVLGNELVELGFDRTSGGALVSILDRKTGRQARRASEAKAVPYRLVLRRAYDTRGRKPGLGASPQYELGYETIDGDRPVSFSWRTREDGAATTLILSSAPRADRDLRVRTSVTLEAGSPLSRWRMEVLRPADAAVYRLTCPIVAGFARLGDPAPGEAILYPQPVKGFLFHDPYRTDERGIPLSSGLKPGERREGVGELHQSYPGGAPIQMMAYYNDFHGLYFATYDDSLAVKSFDIAPVAGWGLHPVMSVSHLPSEAMGADFVTSYDTVLGVFHGDWYDAADFYKAWASRQWWCAKKLGDRDIADWMRRGAGIFQLSNYTCAAVPDFRLNNPLERIAEETNAMSGKIGVPLLGLVYNWEGSGPWTGPVGTWPPREGEAAFRQAMRRLRDAGNLGFVYVTTRFWYLLITWYPEDHPYNTWRQFDAEGRPHAVMTPRGAPNLSLDFPQMGWQTARMCPHPGYSRDLYARSVLEAIRLGCPVVQLDCFPGAPMECYNPSHGHPLGFGPWLARAQADWLAELRRDAKAVDPECTFTSEGISEHFIPWLDMYDNRQGLHEYWGYYGPGLPLGGEDVPLFAYVYHPYIGSFLSAFPELNQPETFFWNRCLGKTFAYGVVPNGGRHDPTYPDFNTLTLRFYERIVRAAAKECWKYVMFGEMLRPPPIDVPRVQGIAFPCSTEGRLSVDRTDPRTVEDAAVRHSAWRAPDGTIGFLFANISEQSVRFAVPLSAYDNDGPFDVSLWREGRKATVREGVKLPATVELEMAALSVLLVELSPSGRPVGRP